MIDSELNVYNSSNGVVMGSETKRVEQKYYV